MRRVLCYVEGPADKLALQALLHPMIEARHEQGIAIEFFETPGGDRKKSVVLKGPLKAINILRNIPDAQVALIPDLFPMNRGFPHTTAGELRRGMLEIAEKAVERKNLDRRLLSRLQVFCLKHDLEALILAADRALAHRLGVAELVPSWVRPVEDQNLEKPPKRIVEELFERHGRRYRGTVDAPAILESEGYAEIAERCPQCFAPFIGWLESL